MIQQCEAKPLVRIEDRSRWQLRSFEQVLVSLLYIQIHPHPLHLGTTVAQLRSVLLGQTCEHVDLSLGSFTILQEDDTETLAFEANVLVGFHGELWHFLHQPRLGLLGGLFLRTSWARHLVSHSGLRMQVDPVFQGQEVEFSGICILLLSLCPLLYEHSGKLLHLESLDNVRLILRHEAKLHCSLEYRLRGKRLPHQRDGFFIGEEQRLRLRHIRCQELVDVILGESFGLVWHEFGELVEDCLALQLAL
mmetsp:Transcript_107046/g.255584  ORF Transcript_107046/g.255584 Transcript_107046/m.255584 type:complete len:249 (+) Transcript_107046:230-976(+)